MLVDSHSFVTSFMANQNQAPTPPCISSWFLPKIKAWPQTFKTHNLVYRFMCSYWPKNGGEHTCKRWWVSLFLTSFLQCCNFLLFRMWYPPKTKKLLKLDNTHEANHGFMPFWSSIKSSKNTNEGPNGLMISSVLYVQLICAKQLGEITLASSKVY